MDKGVAKIFADGGSRGNPGPAGAGAVINVGSETVASLSQFLGHTTNNVAEYTGLLLGLEKASELGFKHVEVAMDSELVVKQMKGEYRVKNEKLLPLFEKARRLAATFASFKIVHVKREYNRAADRLANQAMDMANSSS
ncbi:MAG: ribonuclease H [Candidatus Melainabacteria bacterium]|nr:MAG: ribonuclease H [Candidatus Melainabacteria bacterium]